ncbi:MAG: putative ABC transporter permease [Clostridia bacterium]
MKVKKSIYEGEDDCEKNKSFAFGINFYKVILVFIIGCFLGDIYEIALELLKHGELVTRQGVLYGPFNPVYGMGAVVFELLFYKMRNLKIVFVVGTLIGGIFEYLCSFLQEKIFGTLSWDYSGNFMNFQGRTSLYIALFWGILAVVFVSCMMPLFDKYIEKIPNRVGIPLSWFVAIFMVINMSISALAVYRYSAREKGIPANTKYEQFLDNTYPDIRVKKSFPNMVFKK